MKRPYWLMAGLSALLAPLTVPLAAQAPAAPPFPAPSEIVAAAPADDWLAIDPADLLVMTLAPDARGRERRVVIQLMPAPFSQGWVGNIRALAAVRWWDGLSINRVQDNYVVQWGDADGEDAAKARALPEGLTPTVGARYTISGIEFALHLGGLQLTPQNEQLVRDQFAANPDVLGGTIQETEDAYADYTNFFEGWPIGIGDRTDPLETLVWPVHCYGMVGVGRNLSPDTGSGAELYTVIGHAPRHLDRNIAVVGRVIEGIEHLSSLPRGTGALGFYESAEERVPIASIRLAPALPAADQPRFEYLSTESESFARYADVRANRRDPFFNVPAGGADICNIPVPVRRVAMR